jgi:hypothetical protein
MADVCVITSYNRAGTGNVCSCSPSCYNYATKVSGTPCPVCKGKMTTAVQLVEPEPKSGGSKPVPVPVMAGEGSGSSRGYVRDMMTYTVMDDLSIEPVSTISAVTSIIALGVSDISGLQARTVEIGHKEVMILTPVSLLG